jgi:hypothetical protein
MSNKDFQYHPTTVLFPMLDADELGKLAEDIKQNGLLEAIVLYEGMILDGRNRYEACRSVGVKPRFTELPELIPGTASPVQYVVSANLHRRHLTTSQRAAIGAEMIPLLAQEAEKRQKIGRPPARQDGQKELVAESPQVLSSNGIKEIKGKARDIAAKAVGVGGRIVQKALAVKRADPKKFEEVKRGKTTVEAARRDVADKVPTKRQDTRERAAYRRMGACFSRIEAGCDGLKAINLKAALKQCPEGEGKHWKRVALERAKELRAFAREM